MTLVANVRQEEAWNGEEGRRWADHYQRLDRMAAPANEHLFAAAGIGERDRVLDIGCGTGETTRIAARHAARGHAVGIDLSTPLLEIARRISAEQAIGNITFERGDAQVHPLSDAHFEVAISRAGVMFFDDPVAAFANVRRSLRPKGRLAFLCHRAGKNQTDVIFDTLAQHLPTPDLQGRLGGVADFTDPTHIRDVLNDAGFTAIATSPVEYLTELGDDAAHATDFLLDVQLAGFVSGAEEAAMARVRAALAEALRRYERDSTVRLRASAWIVTAQIE
ncbi:methyltransferase domain-containing protein [Nonomuraea sp. NPDC050786]|uniref:class I SAM-dependent methyltransferase n=1 Tax=Nonomuraea sp. NPDC050786 TaxID=3154840 RepID=UPI0033EA4337